MTATKTKNPWPVNHHPSIHIELKPVEEHLHQLPRRNRAPFCLPLHAPLPRKGEVIYLTSTSAWGVSLVVHEWLATDTLHIVVWLEPLGSTHHGARVDFGVTQ